MSDLESTLFYVTNRGDKPFSVTYAKRQYVIPNDGTARPMPVEPLKMAVGNWDAKDTEYVRYRSNEVRRLSMQYATYGAPWYSDDPGQMTAGIVEAGEKIHPYSPSQRVDGRRQFMHPNLPRLEVTDLDGNRIFTVLDDPDLEIGSGRELRRIETAHAEAVTNDLAIMERKMAALLETLEKVAPEAAVEYRQRVSMPTPMESTPVDHNRTGHVDAGLDLTATTDAMSIMNEELGLDDAPDLGDDEPAEAPRPVKKAAAKRAAVRGGE